MLSVSTDVDLFIKIKLHQSLHCVQEGTGMSQVEKLPILREERKPTRCNNIDDLLSIVDVDY